MAIEHGYTGNIGHGQHEQDGDVACCYFHALALVAIASSDCPSHGSYRPPLPLLSLYRCCFILGVAGMFHAGLHLISKVELSRFAIQDVGMSVFVDSLVGNGTSSG